MKAARQARDGFGMPLTVVLGMVLTAACTGIAFLWLSSMSMEHASRAAGALSAEAAAESAVEEAYYHLQLALNDPDSSVYTRVRAALLNRSPGALDLSDGCGQGELLRDVIKTSPDRPQLSRLSIGPPKATLYPAGSDQRAPQTLILEAAASLGGGPPRAVRHVRYLGITPVFPARPFDQCTFAIVEYDLLKILPDIVRETKRLIERYDEVGTLMNGWAAIAEANTCPRPLCFEGSCCGCMIEPGCCGCPAAHCHRKPVSRFTTTWFFDRRQTNFSAGLFPCERYTFPRQWVPISPAAVRAELQVPPDSAIVAVEPQVKLADFDHERALAERYEPAIRELKDHGEKLNQLIEQAIGRVFCKDDHATWHGQMMREGRAMRQALTTAIDVLNQVLRHIKDHTRPGLTTGVYHAGLAASGPTPLALHADSLQTLDAAGFGVRPLSGHLAWFGESALRLELTGHQGKTVVSAAPEAGGEVIAGDISLADSRRDRLDVWARQLTLQGSAIEASLFANERAHFVSAPAIRGNLILRHFIHRTLRGADEDLRGTIDYDKAVFAGTPLDGNYLSHLPIGVSPKLLAREVAP